MRLPAPLLAALVLLGALPAAAAARTPSRDSIPRPSSGPVSGPVSGSAGTTTGTVGAAGPLGPYAGPTTRSWTACGGPSQTTLLCAEVWVGVSGFSTTVRVRNVSGAAGLPLPEGAATDGRWVLTTVGFDGLPPVANALITYFTDGAWWQRAATTREPRPWLAVNDGQFGGGERIDLAIDNGAGISGGIASSCAPVGTLPGGSNRLWMTPNPGCELFTVADAAATPWFEARVLTTAAWDPNDDLVAVYLKGQNGPGGASWECLVGGARPRGDCADLAGGVGAVGAVVPEPGTVVLVATGLAGVAVAGWRRRRAMLAVATSPRG